ncbi:MAG: peptidoglycan DD-metalloendopeptidase family protein [Chthonomonadales bacterium]|nr:peptidoglycan DD-metalloendopeptidase family protein [Chthonomonadales bacterium]
MRGGRRLVKPGGLVSGVVVGLMLAASIAGAWTREAPSEKGLVAALARSGDAAQLLLLDSAGRVVRAGEFKPGRVFWSSDGRRLAIAAGAEGSRGPLWIVDTFHPDTAWMVHPQASGPAWSPDGRQLAFAGPDGIMIGDLAARAVTPLRGAERGYAPSWEPGAAALVFARASGNAGSVWRVPASGGTPERLAMCARPLALAWSPFHDKLAVLESDPERMATPRLSIFARSSAGLASPINVQGTAIRWSRDGETVFVRDGRDLRCIRPTARSVTEVGASAGSIVLEDRETDATLLLRPKGGSLELAAIGQSDARTLGSLPDGAVLIDADWSRSAALAEAIASATPPRPPAAPTPVTIVQHPQAVTDPPLRAQTGGSEEPEAPIVPPIMPPHVSPMIFPVCGGAQWSDSYGAARDGGRRQHRGQDLMAPKMRPVVAAFDGSIVLRQASSPGGHHWLMLIGDNGWTAYYMHLNNDTPGTDDGMASLDKVYAPGLMTGARVRAGELLGFVGDSGNAEETAPHLHFELMWTATGAFVNPRDSLKGATSIQAPLQGRSLSTGSSGP